MAEGREQLENTNGVLLDLDGTVFVGSRLVPGAAEAIAALRRTGMPIRFGTNTTRMSRTSLVERIRRLGVDLEPEEVFTAPLAASSWLENVMGGAELVALQRNRYWETGKGLDLDAGAFVAALEYATGQEATIVGKPSQAFFEAAAESMGADLANVAVVGDDITTDVAGAQRCGAAAVLVRTGKFREDDLSPAAPKPDLVLDSVASLPSALGVALR